YFLESLRSKYFLNTNEINDDFIKKLTLKSGNTLEKTQKLMQLITHVKEKSVHSEADLLELNKQIEAVRLENDGRFTGKTSGIQFENRFKKSAGSGGKNKSRTWKSNRWPRKYAGNAHHFNIDGRPFVD